MSQKLTKEFDGAMKSLRELVKVTEEAIEKHRSRGDSKALCELIFEQRHNLKVLFRKIRKARK